MFLLFVNMEEQKQIHVLAMLALPFLDFGILCCGNIIAMDIAQNMLEINHVCYSTQGLMDYFSIAHFKIKNTSFLFFLS